MEKKQNNLFIICALIIAGLAVLGYILLESSHKKDLETALNDKNMEWQGKTDKLMEKIDTLEKEISAFSGEDDQPFMEQDNPEDGNDLSEPDKKPQTSDNFDDVERRIASFFLYLDKQEYVKKHKIKGSTYNEYEEAVQKLSEKKPLIANETESLYNMFLNIAHFYRVLGNDKLSLFKDVLANEDEKIETTMRDFYLWYTYNDKNKKRIKGRPSPQVLYGYAGFFLNTIGGRNYLMRRDSKVRILTSYYSVLILDKSNDMKQNPNGIDIRPYLKLLFSDLSDKTGFAFHSEYMKNLGRLMDKYNII